MNFNKIQNLNHKMIKMEDADKGLGISHKIIDFENSDPGIWIRLESHEKYNSSIKSIIQLALVVGFAWEAGEAESNLELKSENLEALDDHALDELAAQAISFLDESAYESDPGWRIYLNPQGLIMESIFTDESDIWSEDRELRAPPPPVSPSAMRKTLNLDKSTRSFQISEELTSVLMVREIVNADGKIKELHDLTLEDMSEILDEIKSEELNEDEFQELAYARSEIEPELVTALKFLEQAVQSIDFDPDWTNAYIESGFDRIIERVRKSDNLSLSKKIALFEELTGTEDNWFSPICGVTMALLWNLPEQSMDECIMRYAKLRGESSYEDDPWSSDPNNNDYRHWMPLLVLAALGSSGSQKIMKVIDQTCNTSSAMPFWMLICVLTMYFTDPESFGNEESENGDWFPENYWQECIFSKEYQSIKINNNALGELIGLYVSRVGDWIWTNSYNLTQDEIDNYLVKITSD
jgi:hypothetical protein